MKTLTLDEVRKISVENPMFWHLVLAASKMNTAGTAVEIDDAKLAEIKTKIGIESQPQATAVQATAKPIKPIPRDQWEPWINAVAKMARPEDKGIGDVIARTIGPVGGSLFKSWFFATFGRKCRCNARQSALNAKYPLNAL
jgi:hypothetical protein